MDQNVDLAGAYTEDTIDHAVKRGLRATTIISSDITRMSETCSRAEKYLIEDVVSSLTEANLRLWRLYQDQKE